MMLASIYAGINPAQRAPTTSSTLHLRIARRLNGHGYAPVSTRSAPAVPQAGDAHPLKAIGIVATIIVFGSAMGASKRSGAQLRPTGRARRQAVRPWPPQSCVARVLLRLFGELRQEANYASSGHQYYSNVYNLNIGIETHNEDNSANIAFYFNGVGSNNSSGLGTRAAGIGVADVIQQVYVNICSNFNGGDEISAPDKIYLFGFLRGAYIVQSICNLINEYGLLFASRINYFNEMYQHWIGQYPELTKDKFVSQYCRKHVQIEFVGLFDSVFGFYKEDRNSPLLRARMDENRAMPSVVKVGAHLLAIDEHRSFFGPFPWKGISHPTQKIHQIWMPGNHSDVGGGYRDDFLSTISLRRMLEIISKRTYLKLDQERFDELDRKLKGETAQDDKKYVHDERHWTNRRPPFFSKSFSGKWPRKDYLAREHFVDQSIAMLEGHFVFRGKNRSQYTLPDDLKSISVFEA
jgi:hypothetical protein